ncbi:ATP-binding cassette domain-containing protein [Paenibacillus sp. UNC499MF]|uniref:ATP-binding cassette domain-containing protein n=1 Tax=Paenibacillus sp. UNC499MF TaxID=1502751 RepID=UPI00089FEFEC|nr:ATP-binding cassette domain-containing protein [Paenibacillus sp. UNC499MF]SEG14824.1 Energy-coupling factor transporter ATP-binding protein EcfA2 [Paenibacillus sp. UNC499MF]
MDYDLHVKNLSKTVGGPEASFAVRDVSFTARAGEITLLIGRSGAGKSTLLDMLGGLSVPGGGSIRYGNTGLWPGSRQSVREARRELALVFQHPHEQLFAATVRGEFQYTLRPFKLSREEREVRTAEALELFGLGPELLDERPHELSGGTQRRAALASVFASRPRWLLLDEPTAGLDHEAAARLTGTLRDWTRRTGGGVLVATHDLDAFLPVADRIVMISQGTVVHDCTPAELAARPALAGDAGLLLPEALALGSLLRRHGVDVPAGLPAPEETARAIAAALAAQALRGQGAVAAAAGFAATEARAQGESAAVSAHASVSPGSEAREAGLRGLGGAAASGSPPAAASGSSTDPADVFSAGPLESGIPAASPAAEGNSSTAEKVQAGTSADDRSPSSVAGLSLSSASGAVSVSPLADGTAADNPSASAISTRAGETEPASILNEVRYSACDIRPANAEGSGTPAPAASGISAPSSHSSPAPAAAPRPPAMPVGRRFDPRTFWIGYVLVSAGILLQHSLAGLAAAAVITVLAVLLSQVPFGAVWKPLRAFLIFTGVSAVIAGLKIGAGQGGSPVGFDPQAAFSAVRALSNLMLVLVLGVLFPLAVGYLRMKQGVEQGLSALARLKFPVEAVALTASLMFRFIPLIGGLWNRFGRIAKARGQGRGVKSGLGFAEFRIMALPFMFALIRMADEFSTALEIRGYSRTGGSRTRSQTLRMQARDYAAIGVFLLVFLSLAFLARLLG